MLLTPLLKGWHLCSRYNKMDMVTVIPVKHVGILTVNMLVILVISLTSKISKSLTEIKVMLLNYVIYLIKNWKLIHEKCTMFNVINLIYLACRLLVRQNKYHRTFLTISWHLRIEKNIDWIDSIFRFFNENNCSLWTWFKIKSKTNKLKKSLVLLPGR